MLDDECAAGLAACIGDAVPVGTVEDDRLLPHLARLLAAQGIAKRYCACLMTSVRPASQRVPIASPTSRHDRLCFAARADRLAHLAPRQALLACRAHSLGELR